jgi:hypothetical protein
VSYEEPPLFDSPSTAQRRPYRPPATGVRYTRRGKTRALCDDCCQDIHRRGQEVAPYPRPALWRRTDEAGTVLLLCQMHKDRRVDDAAG